MAFLGDLIQQHGWHVIAELATLVVATIVTGLWIRALIRGRARPVECSSCGRIGSRATRMCPRCGTRIEAAG